MPIAFDSVAGHLHLIGPHGAGAVNRRRRRDKGGGGAIIVAKFGVKQRLPIALHSTATAFEEVRIGLN